MGMTIADNIDFLNEAKKVFEDIANNPSINETVKTYLTIESLESAIEVMCKYQKIEQIVKEMKDSDSDIVGLYRHKTEYYMGMIERVLEDGNDD